jgi:hypothetical protein
VQGGGQVVAFEVGGGEGGGECGPGAVRVNDIDLLGGYAV